MKILRGGRRGPILVVPVLLLVAGCLSARPDPTVFLVLTPPPSPAVTSQAPAPGLESAVLGVGPVTLPAYLDRPQLVTRAHATELAVDGYARWSAPLGVLFAEALAGHLAVLTGPRHVVIHPWPSRDVPVRSVRVAVEQFEPEAAGQAVLRARWEVVDGGGQPLVGSRLSEHRTPMGPQPTDAALALSQLVGLLAAEVAAVLRQGPAPQSPG